MDDIKDMDIDQIAEYDNSEIIEKQAFDSYTSYYDMSIFFIALQSFSTIIFFVGILINVIKNPVRIVVHKHVRPKRQIKIPDPSKDAKLIAQGKKDKKQDSVTLTKSRPSASSRHSHHNDRNSIHSHKHGKSSTYSKHDNDSFELLTFLLNRGVNCDVRDHNGDALFMLAIKQKKLPSYK